MSKCRYLYTTLAVLLHLTFTVLGQNDIEEVCPRNLVDEDPTSLETFGSVCYRLVNRESLFDAVGAECQAMGGRVASPQSEDLDKFFIEALEKRGWDSVWIGLEDKDREGTYVWADGEQLSYENFADRNGVKRFGIGSLVNSEDCVALNMRDRKWHDYICERDFLGGSFVGDTERRFVCRFD